MKLSAKSRYAARILLELAAVKSAAPMTASQISERTGISIQFIEQILRPLRQAHITRSLRGVAGGHVLAKPPETTTLGDVVRAMEGEIRLTLCGAGDHFSCPRRETCLTRPAWARLSRVLEQEMDAISLTDLLSDTQDICPTGAAAKHRQGEDPGLRSKKSSATADSPEKSR